MNAKQIITLAVGILALCVTVWKGPSVWGAISVGITTVALFIATLKIVPKDDEEYIQDLEDALAKSSTPAAASGENLATEKSRARFARRIAKL